MSPNSAGRAEKLGYTNVKVYHEGLPEWTKRNYTVLSPQFLKEAFIDKDIPMVLLDVRSAAKARNGFIKGAVTLPAADVAANLAKFPPRDKKPPIIIYDQSGGDDAKTAAKALIAAGYGPTIMTGGMDAWQAARHTVETGELSTNILYVPKPRPGEISIDVFKKLAANIPADTLILDVRSKDEADAGMIKGAKVVPDAEILDRLADVPRNK
ncbi:MAG TPA: rhodanese-like domain-containing protein, partial [Nitrospirota bacterium]